MIDMTKLSAEQIKILAQAADKKTRVKVQRPANPDDDKTWSQLFDINPELFGDKVK